MKRRKTVYFAISLVMILLIAGCGGNKVTGKITAKLTSKTVKDGGTTTFELDGKNTGNVAANVVLQIIPEDTSKIKIQYPGSLEETLQPDEKIGTKMVKVQGFTDYSETKYWIIAQLIDKDSGKLLDQEKVWLTVKK